MAKKILVIEDDKFLRGLISQKLSKEGYEIVEAVDGEEGLTKASKEKPDLVLLDLILPGIDGFEVLEKLKDNTETKEISVVILSNLGQREEIERGLRIGAVDFLVKAHHTPLEIVEKIRTFLE